MPTPRVMDAERPAQAGREARAALVHIAREERAAAGQAPPPDPLVRLRCLEHPRTPARRATVLAPDPLLALDGELTAKQRQLLDVLLASPSVSAAAASLGMSRSNVYAGLRRVGRKVGVPDVSELLRLLRTGRLVTARER